MGNTCTCFNEDNKDKEEFRSVRAGAQIESKDSSAKRAEEVVTI